MLHLFIVLIFLSFNISQDNYVFNENIKLTDSSSNQKYPEVIINNEGFSIEQEASDDLRRKIKEAINFDDISLQTFH